MGGRVLSAQIRRVNSRSDLLIRAGRFRLVHNPGRALDVGCAQEILRVFVDTVADMVDQSSDSGIDQFFGAVDAWKMSHVVVAASSGNSVQSCLDNGAGFSMIVAYVMTFDQHMADFIPGGCPA